MKWQRDAAGTGNAALVVGATPHQPRVWLLAHLDQISYMVDPGDGDRYPLVPFCYHMQRAGARPGLALGFDLARGALTVRARGEIVVDGATVSFVIQEGGPLGPGDRVVYDSSLVWDRTTNGLTGYLDDSVGCAALLLAATVLRHYPVEVLFGFTDEEEGPPGDANQSFCRGGRRLADLFPRPELVLVCDVHEAEAMVRGAGPSGLAMGDGAVFAERSSAGRGSVTPPQLYAIQRHLATALQPRGIDLRENWGGYVARSEDINAVAVTANIGLLGVLCSNRHYAEDQPRANLADVVALAKALVGYVLLVHSDLWGRLVGRSS
ncbi:MAG: hypothetical protein U0031_06925 [Thermomicrobiales bacterium]